MIGFSPNLMSGSMLINQNSLLDVISLDMPVVRSLGSEVEWNVSDEVSCLLQLTPTRLGKLRSGDWEGAGVPESTRDRLEGMCVGLLMLLGLYKPDPVFQSGTVFNPAEEMEFLGHRYVRPEDEVSGLTTPLSSGNVPLMYLIVTQFSCRRKRFRPPLNFTWPQPRRTCSTRLCGRQ